MISGVQVLKLDRAQPDAAPGVEEHIAPQSEAEPEKRFCVVLHNDDINGFDYVVGVVCRVVGCGKLEGFWLTLRAHLFGRSRVWTGPKATAMEKAAALVAAGPDPRKVDAGARPLRVTVEPLE